MKKKFSASADKTEGKRKKRKVSQRENTEDDIPKPELLDINTLREGMLLLGCVTDVRSGSLQMSLPGCLIGTVPIIHISNRFTQVITEAATNNTMEEPRLSNIAERGISLPCKVLRITQKEGLKKKTIVLSVNPADVNSDLRPKSLYCNMVLHAAVESKEDHGYVMDIGVKRMQGFLPYGSSCGSDALRLGQIVPTCIKKMPHEEDGGNVVWLKLLSYNETFPEMEDDTIKLGSVLPGMNVTAYITEIKKPFVHMQCIGFQACANGMSLGKSLKETSKISGTVLYVHPVTRVIYLLLGKKPTPQIYQSYFRFGKMDLVQNVKFQYTFYNMVLFSLGKGAFGYIKKAQLPSYGDRSLEGLLLKPLVAKSRVFSLHFMDNLTELTFKESLVEMDIKKADEIQVGETYNGIIKNHGERGMYVSLWPGQWGLVRRIHISDSMISQPEKLCPRGSEIRCRVLSTKPLYLTCKKTLLKLPEEDILKSYQQAKTGNCYKGVIVDKTPKHILIVFFNNVKGIVPPSLIPQSSVLFVGQTISCQVVQCSPVNQTLTLSLKCDKPVTRKSSSSDSKPMKLNKITARSLMSDNELWKQALVDEATNGTSKPKEYVPATLHKAVIKSIKPSQINLIAEGSVRGRVHITEIGSFSEGMRPLKQFKVGEKIKVHVLSSFDVRSHNFLEISHQVVKRFLECSFAFPPPTPLDQEVSKDCETIGYVDKAHPTCATIWLSPYQKGILEYLDCSQNLKVLRKLKKSLKPGVSVKVTALSTKKSDDKTSREIHLTKLGSIIPEVGQNIAGLVQLTCPEKGMMLKLANSYHGIVSLTDLQDVYGPATAFFSKHQKLRFILCHVLEVDHATKYCQLSLRKSRLYPNVKVPQNFCPELNVETIKTGNHLKGIIKSVLSDCILISLGRGLEGKVSLHKCSDRRCHRCKQTANILEKNTPGSVIEVVVDGPVKKNLIELSVPEFTNMGVTEYKRLIVEEDINWDEV